MKKKLTILAFGLLLAVGWTNVAQAQKLADPLAIRGLAKAAAPVEQNFVMKAGEEVDIKTLFSGDSRMKAPRRANYTVTADATHVYDWYNSKTYTWSNASGTYTASYTDPATDPYQMAYLLGKTYVNPELPGIKYTACYSDDHPYYNIEFGWNIPADGKWAMGESSSTTYGDITITAPNGYVGFKSISVYSGTTLLESWVGTTNTTNLPSSYWSFGTSSGTTCKFASNNDGSYYLTYGQTGGGFITISSSLINGLTDITVVINAAIDAGYSGYSITVNNVSQTPTNTFTDYTWTISPGGSSSGATSVTPPYENGYTVFLVKVKDYDISSRATQTTSSWSDIISYFNTYYDEVVMLTDGMRVEEGQEDAGTIFTYSGLLNRFFFLSKGKMAYISSSSSSSSYDLAPTYGMYEEFSPTTTDNTSGIDDFYSRMLEGESYDIIHDCQGVNYMQHFFSMTGMSGTDQKSLTNLIFYIPDNRGQSMDRNYVEDHLPQVGLYNITLTAKAKPVANYSSTNRYYDVTNDWVSSLNRILDFDVDQDYELWIWIYDNEGNPVAKEKVEGTDLFHNTLTYTYTVPQYPESYTIVYRVKGWPTDATNNPVNDPDGTFYTWSNLAEVVIPGYSEFLSVGLDHYESDFVINEEHNYYRNFLTVANQNPENQLTPNRVLAGENLFKLYRYEDSVENTKVKAADLRFYQSGNTIRYKIDYYGQNILSGYELPMTTPVVIDTAGVVATLGGGGGTTTTTDVTFTAGTNTSSSTNPPTITLDGVTITNTNSTGNASFNYSPYRLYTGTLNISANSGTITKIVFNSNSTNYPVSNITGTGYTYSGNTGTWEGRSSNVSLSLSGQVRCTSIVVTVETTSKGADRAYTLLDNQLNVANYTTGYVYPNDPWSLDGTQLRLQDNGYFYILNGTGLNFTMPSGYSGANVKFEVKVGNSNYYHGTFNFVSSTGATQSIATTAVNQVGDCVFTNVNSGDVINIKGTCYYSTGTTLYSYSPDFVYLYVYVEGGQSGIGGDDPLYLADIMFVDQFKAETKNDTHPRLYSYFLQFDNPETGEVAKSSPRNVPVQHTGATLGGYYTTEEIQGDTERELTMNVMNADVNMTLANNPAIYYYTLDRKPSTTPNANWLELSELQIRTNGTYQEIDELLPQYIEQTVNPGPVERYDNYDVQTGNYNSYMSYVPIVWTHGELVTNKRIKWETERKHNSYGAPIWKTGVGQVTLYPQGLAVERQLGKNGSTNWKDENGDSCSVYMIKNLHALGEIPTNNTVGNQNGYVPYVPYWFNVYAYSPSGQLRGYSWVGEPGVDPDNTGSPGSGVVNNTETDRYLWHIYGGRTNSGDLLWTKSNTWADNMIFGALDDITDLKIVVRFYYVVDGMAGMRAGGPAGYGAESPGVGPEIETGIIENWTNRNIVSTIYVNPQGMQSTVPFDGVNIVINRYDDGTTSTSKVIK